MYKRELIAKGTILRTWSDEGTAIDQPVTDKPDDAVRQTPEYKETYDAYVAEHKARQEAKLPFEPKAPLDPSAVPKKAAPTIPPQPGTVPTPAATVQATVPHPGILTPLPGATPVLTQPPSWLRLRPW